MFLPLAKDPHGWTILGAELAKSGARPLVGAVVRVRDACVQPFALLRIELRVHAETDRSLLHARSDAGCVTCCALELCSAGASAAAHGPTEGCHGRTGRAHDCLVHRQVDLVDLSARPTDSVGNRVPLWVGVLCEHVPMEQVDTLIAIPAHRRSDPEVAEDRAAPAIAVEGCEVCTALSLDKSQAPLKLASVPRLKRLPGREGRDGVDVATNHLRSELRSFNQSPSRTRERVIHNQAGEICFSSAESF